MQKTHIDDFRKTEFYISIQKDYEEIKEKTIKTISEYIKQFIRTSKSSVYSADTKLVRIGDKHSFFSYYHYNPVKDTLSYMIKSICENHNIVYNHPTKLFGLIPYTKKYKIRDLICGLLYYDLIGYTMTVNDGTYVILNILPYKYCWTYMSELNVSEPYNIKVKFERIQDFQFKETQKVTFIYGQH